MATIYDIITTDIITALEAGVAPWQQPWSEASAPTNLVSRKAYRGVNVWLLLAARRTSPYWLTFKQALDLGGHVRKGERGRRIVYWHVSEATDDATGQVERHFAPRYSTVFNVEQCDGLTVPALEAPAVTVDPNEAAEAIVAGYVAGPTLDTTGHAAYYRPSTDHVTVPPRASFRDASSYYATLFHELIHSTGHWSRLRRFEATTAHRFGSETYSKEELVAELGAAYLLGAAGLEAPQVQQHAAYLKGWIAALRGDSRLILQAAAAAQKAADHVRGVAAVTLAAA